MPSTHRTCTRYLLATVLLVVLVGARQSVYAATAQQGGQTVQMLDFKFAPQSLTVPAGTTVTWANGGKAPHTATSDTGAFDTGTVAAGQSITVTFSKAGTFPYYCALHGAAGGAGMAGTIVVTAAAQPSTVVPTNVPSVPAQAVTPVVQPAAAAPYGDRSDDSRTYGDDHSGRQRDGQQAVPSNGAGRRDDYSRGRSSDQIVAPATTAGTSITASAVPSPTIANAPTTAVTSGEQSVMVPVAAQQGADLPRQVQNTAGSVLLPVLMTGGLLALLAGLVIRRRRHGRPPTKAADQT